MFNHYKKCCCQNNYNPKVIETICNNVGTSPEYEDNHGCVCDNNNSCGFHEEKKMNVFPENPMLAQSYVPVQQLENTFTPKCGLKMGTIFPELVSPYMPGQSMREIEYLRMQKEECDKSC